jgi:NADPH:quinone reductase-like Zn-dependent oxidoreductase
MLTLFQDVMISMGIMEETDIYRMGGEGSGTVAEIGKGVKHLAVGDRVLFLHNGCFSTKITSDALRCVKIPVSLSFVEAATMPASYVTAIYSLVDIGELKNGQSVLIHSAVGGVGLAAMQICTKIFSVKVSAFGDGQFYVYFSDCDRFTQR